MPEEADYSYGLSLHTNLHVPHIETYVLNG